MKQSLFLVFVLCLSQLVGQEHNHNVEQCLSHKYIDYMDQKVPGYKSQVQDAFEVAKYTPTSKTNQEYVIPVVVHVVYNTPDQNIPDSTIQKQIELLNLDFKRQNADTINMRTDFEIVKGNPNIKFVLAQIDPDGNPSTGITRTSTSIETFADIGLISGNFEGLERIKSTADGGSDAWDTERYLNIWVGNMALFGQTFLLGYASPPAGLPNWPPGSIPNIVDGVVLQFDAVGDNNPNQIDFGAGPQNALGRTATHEVGHYLGLRHIWGDGDCNEEDGIDDTPNADAQSDFDCDSIKNSCVDNIQGFDLPDMIENYMDYSAETCQNSFTQGQVDLMRSVLENQRFDLVNDNPANVTFYELAANIYPNPVSASLTVEVGFGKATNYEVIDIRGKSIMNGLLNSETNTIDCSMLQKGSYFVRLFNSGVPVTTKRIVKM